MTEVEQQAPAPTTEAPAKEEVVEEKKVEAEAENKEEEKKDEEKKEDSEKDDKVRNFFMLLLNHFKWDDMKNTFNINQIINFYCIICVSE